MMQQTVKTACKRIWSRPYTNLCLHSDLPRLSHNLEIVDERTGQMVRLPGLIPLSNGDPSQIYHGIEDEECEEREERHVKRCWRRGGFWNPF